MRRKRRFRPSTLAWRFATLALIALGAAFACAPNAISATPEPEAIPTADVGGGYSGPPIVTPLPTAALAATAAPLATAAMAPAATELPVATSIIPSSTAGAALPISVAEAEEARTRFQRLLRASWKTDFTRSTIAFDEIMTGGPPKDGIPAIDDPRFESIAEADGWLDESEAVQVVNLNGDARAYPVQVMVWHELVNDTVGGEPVVITY